MVFGYEAPVAAVCRVVAIVALHPVVVHLEGVLSRKFAIDVVVDASSFYFVALKYCDCSLIERKVLLVKGDCHAFLWYPDRSVEVNIPIIVGFVWEEVVVGKALHRCNEFNLLDVWQVFQLLDYFF